MNAELILLDEKAARRVAAARGIRVMGTLVLLDLPAAIDRFPGACYRFSPALLRATLDRSPSR